MNPNRPILSLQQDCDTAVPLIVTRMQKSGLQVICTFDLHQTRTAETDCSCPHHGTDQCDCQMIVLLVYGKDTHPVSVIAHGHNGQTRFSLVEFLGAANDTLVNQIRDLLSPAEPDFLAGDLV